MAQVIRAVVLIFKKRIFAEHFLVKLGIKDRKLRPDIRLEVV